MQSFGKPVCWCGNDDLIPYNKDYLLCNSCQTLVLSRLVTENFLFNSDEDGLYSKSYWLEHQQNDFGYSDIFVRARKDLSERCLYWLKTFLKYKNSPGSTLELGSSHGGFVAMLQWAGFQASGLELSPWVVDYARKTFGISMYLGQVEDQNIEPNSLDAIILMDVLEHFPDPVKTISYIVSRLKENGILMIQTPCFLSTKTYEELKLTRDPFLEQFKPPEHVYLFSPKSVQQFLETCGLKDITFEQAIFSHYDMFLVASPSTLSTRSQEEIEHSLLETPGGRLVLALLDKDAECKQIMENWAIAEADRAARLEVIHSQASQYDQKSAQYEELTQAFQELNAKHADLNAIYLDLSSKYTDLDSRYLDLGSRYADLDSRYSELSAKYNSLLQAKLAMRIASFEKRMILLFKRVKGSLRRTLP